MENGFDKWFTFQEFQRRLGGDELEVNAYRCTQPLLMYSKEKYTNNSSVHVPETEHCTSTMNFYAQTCAHKWIIQLPLDVAQYNSYM